MNNWIPVYRDYHMTPFISNPLSALGPDISAREPVGSGIDIRTKNWWGIWYEKDNVMICLSNTWHKKTSTEIDELKCDTDYGKGYDILRS